MHSAQAWERLRDPHYSSKLDTVELYELMIQAGYSVEVAEEAAKERANARLDARMKM